MHQQENFPSLALNSLWVAWSRIWDNPTRVVAPSVIIELVLAATAILSLGHTIDRLPPCWGLTYIIWLHSHNNPPGKYDFLCIEEEEMRHVEMRRQAPELTGKKCEAVWTQKACSSYRFWPVGNSFLGDVLPLGCRARPKVPWEVRPVGDFCSPQNQFFSWSFLWGYKFPKRTRFRGSELQ